MSSTSGKGKEQRSAFAVASLLPSSSRLVGSQSHGAFRAHTRIQSDPLSEGSLRYRIYPLLCSHLGHRCWHPPYCTFSTSCSQGARRDTCSCGEVIRADRRRATTCSRFLFSVSVSLLARSIRSPAAPGLYKNRVQLVTALARVSSNN
jgi:hypothetical protein